MWISRKGDKKDLVLWENEPKINTRYYYEGNTIYPFCYKEFSRITGIKLKRSECKEVKIIKLKNGFKFEVIE